jgi:hypothetical protein
MPKDNRFYIATKIGKMEPQVEALKLRLEALGYEMIYDWTKHPVAKPYRDNQADADRAADNMARAVMECDILIVLWSEGGVGFHMETGGGLVAGIVLGFITGQRRKRIFVVGTEGHERSVFYWHHSVTRVADADELLQSLGPAK